MTPQRTPEQQAARKASRARYTAKHAERVSRERQQARIAANTTPTLPLVQWALINSPTSVWAYAARSAT